MLEVYCYYVVECVVFGILLLLLSVQQMVDVIELLKNLFVGEVEFLFDLLIYCVLVGVDDVVKVKVLYLVVIVFGSEINVLISCECVIELLGIMFGGYNVVLLVQLFDDVVVGVIVVDVLKNILLVFDVFYDVQEKVKVGNVNVQGVLQSWVDVEWFISWLEVLQSLIIIVFKVIGEINIDDLLLVLDVIICLDILLYVLVMLKNKCDGIELEEDGKCGLVKFIELLKDKGYLVVYVGDVVGIGLSCKLVINLVLWFIGEDILFILNKCFGGVCLGLKIVLIFYNMMEDVGVLLIEFDVLQMNMGDVIELCLYDGKVLKDGVVIVEFKVKFDVLFDEVCVGGCILLIIGCGLIVKVCEVLGLVLIDLFCLLMDLLDIGKGFLLVQKMVGCVCGLLEGKGMCLGIYCELKMILVGLQDIIGLMICDELKDLVCLGFLVDLVMQLFCYIVVYLKLVDVKIYYILLEFIFICGGILLCLGDGVIYSWFNCMLLFDIVGIGGDLYICFLVGILFLVGLGLVVFVVVIGVMLLDMFELVLVCFKGMMQFGVILCDLVNVILLYVIKLGLLMVVKVGKKNIFFGCILEIEGLLDLKVEQVFELFDVLVECLVVGCLVCLNKELIIEYFISNIMLLKWMIVEGYQDVCLLVCCIEKMEVWLVNLVLLELDVDVEYVVVIEIDLVDIYELIVVCLNDLDDVKMLLDVVGVVIDEVFIGLCMINIGYFCVVVKLLEGKCDILIKLWVVLLIKMDVLELIKEGYYGIFGIVGVCMEMLGCLLCMGNQVQVCEGVMVFLILICNFLNCLGCNFNVYLGLVELVVICLCLGCILIREEYMVDIGVLDVSSKDIYCYMNFDQIEDYQDVVKMVVV